MGNELGIRSDEDHQEQRRIYLVTDGLKSHRTRISYDAVFKEFLKVTVRNDDLQALVDTKISVIEAKIIAHIEYLRDVRKLAYRLDPKEFTIIVGIENASPATFSFSSSTSGISAVKR